MAQNATTALKRDQRSGAKESRGINKKLRERKAKDHARRKEMLLRANKDAREGSATRGKDKFVLLEVPNFNQAEDESEAMTSYLRLGTVPEPDLAGKFDAPKATGEDLAAVVDFFLDDERKRDGCPGFVPPEDRIEETWKLHTKGGWRDHSDGNRITTTRGDKVEVIRGNYKLVVLGREDDPAAGIGWDLSGGHIEGAGMKSCIEWVQTFDGTWRVVESSEKGDTITTQHGNSVSYSYGEIQDSTTGSEDETRPSTDEDDNPIKIPAPNPVITSRTWARRIDSYTGSHGRRVPIITDETWVHTMKSETHAGEISDETHVDGHMSSRTVAETMTDITIVGSMNSVTIGAVSDVTIGNTASVTVGGVEDLTVGALLELTVGAMLEMTVGGTLSVNMGRQEEINLTSSTKMSPAKDDVAGTITRTSATEVSTTGVYKVTAAKICLG
ncbi:MAG: hypothetical protein R3F14_15410 [Polyangiaceae bacterium]